MFSKKQEQYIPTLEEYQADYRRKITGATIILVLLFGWLFFQAFIGPFVVQDNLADVTHPISMEVAEDSTPRHQAAFGQVAAFTTLVLFVLLGNPAYKTIRIREVYEDCPYFNEDSEIVVRFLDSLVKKMSNRALIAFFITGGGIVTTVALHRGFLLFEQTGMYIILLLLLLSPVASIPDAYARSFIVRTTSGGKIEKHTIGKLRKSLPISDITNIEDDSAKERYLIHFKTGDKITIKPSIMENADELKEYLVKRGISARNKSQRGLIHG